MEHIHCRIEYKSNRNPNIKIKINDRVIKKFVADNNYIEFEFLSTEEDIELIVMMTGKEERETEKYFELKKMYFNDIDIKGMIWQTTQMPNTSDKVKKLHEWKGNLYLGHNGYLKYNFKSPITDFLFRYHQPEIKTSHGMESNDKKLLSEMKNYFQKIVDTQKNI